MIIISGAALALTGAAYYPNLIRFKRPEPDLWTLHEFDSMVPAGARLVGWFPEIHSHEQRPREVISIMEMLEHEGEMAEGRLQIKRWLQESVGPWGRPVYFDRPAWEQRDLLWGRFGGPNGVPLAYEDFNFAPRHTRRAVFYELQWSPREAPPGSDAALEPYTVEHWGETPVQWTRRSARFWVEPRAGRGRVKYMVGHPDASPERPVEVTLRRNGGVVERKTHTAPGYFEMTLESDSPTSAAIELRVDLNRFWLADDGRELGLAVFPIEFEDSQN